jgi:hypothetical protein
MAQFSVGRQQHFTQNTRNDIHEVMMLADRYGNIHSLGASATSAFGEPVSVPITPVMQLDNLIVYMDLTQENFNYFHLVQVQMRLLGLCLNVTRALEHLDTELFVQIESFVIVLGKEQCAGLLQHTKILKKMLRFVLGSLLKSKP